MSVAAWRRFLFAAAISVATLVALMSPKAGATTRPTTAWRDGALQVNTAGLISRSDVILRDPPTQPWQSMPLGNGSLGAAVWAQDSFTAQLNRETLPGAFPNQLSSGQVVIPGLKPLETAADYNGRLDLYDGVLQQSGGGMHADAYVDHSRPALIVEVTGADPSTLETVQLNLWPGRTPTTYASGSVAALADTDSRGDTLAAITAAGRDVHATVLNNESVEVQFYPRANGSFRVVAAAPDYDGGDVPSAVKAATSGLTSPPAAALQASTLNSWHAFWRTASPMELSSSDGTADYLETVRAISLYTTKASNSPSDPVPTSNGGVATLFRFNEDQTDWGTGWWHWNLRHYVQADWAAGMSDLNASFFRLYRSHLKEWEAATEQKMGTDGACVPETFNSDGIGLLGGGNTDCDLAGAGEDTALILSSGPEVAHEIWEQYQYTHNLAFLKQNWPVMDETARFLLDYAKLGSDGKLHTSPADALETLQATTDPVTDVAAMKVIFPLVAKVADMLGEDPTLAARLRAAIPEIPNFTIANRDGGVIAASATDAPTVPGFQNPQLEPIWPWGLFGDNGGARTQLAIRTFLNRPDMGNDNWDPSAVQAARLGLRDQVQQILVNETEQFQTCPSGMSDIGRADAGDLCGRFPYIGPYIEWGAYTTLALQESLVQDYNGLLQIDPAFPSDWNADVALKIPGGHTVSTQVRDGVPTLVGIQAARDDTLHIRNPWPGQQIEVVDGTNEHDVIIQPTNAGTITLPVTGGRSYLLQRTAVPYSAFTYAPVSGTAATTVRHLGNNAFIGVETLQPLTLNVPAVTPPGSPVTVTTTLPNSTGQPLTKVSETLSLPSGWTARATSPSTFATVQPGQTVQTTWQVTAPAGANPGSYELDASASFTDAKGPGGLALASAQTEVPFPSLAAAYNNVAITSDSDPTAGSVDGDGNSYSAEALASAGLVAGQQFTHDGITFTWPAAAPGTPDNVFAHGQIIAMSGSGTKLGIIATGIVWSGATVSGTGTINYTDGTSQQFTISFPNWAAFEQPSGTDVVATAPYHNPPGNAFATNIDAATVDLDPGKTVAYVVLPHVSSSAAAGVNAIHIFAMGIG